MTTRRSLLTGLAGCAAASICPLPAKSEPLVLEAVERTWIPLTEVWYPGTQDLLLYGNAVFVQKGPESAMRHVPAHQVRWPVTDTPA